MKYSGNVVARICVNGRWDPIMFDLNDNIMYYLGEVVRCKSREGLIRTIDSYEREGNLIILTEDHLKPPKHLKRFSL